MWKSARNLLSTIVILTLNRHIGRRTHNHANDIRWLSSSAFLFNYLLILTACQPHEHLHTYPRTDEPTTLAALAHRSDQVRTMSASGDLELAQPNGQRVRLDVAVILQPPDRARIRAWKFGTAVFDLTVLPEGIWLEAGKDLPQPGQKGSINSTAAPIGKAWSLVSGEFFRSSNLLATNDGKWMIARATQSNGSTIICRVDRDTLTARQYNIVDEAGRSRFGLTLDDYEYFHGIIWPRRVIAKSESGTVTVDLSDVELNGEPPVLAFKPPRRAEKLP